mmetsp:Transcript_3094/g.4771  ORF Transcript_3094/g.4771 Transcript_3094/m.4771 type:complete len:187 (+) Transcript_3094:114-674(+)
MANNNLPPGWGDRHNKMSEHDMKLGGMAATKFSAKNSYSDNSTVAAGGIYNNSDQVRDFYLNESQRQGDESNSQMGKNSSSVPDFWESRQKEKELQAKQMGVFAKNSDQSSKQPHQQSTSGKEKVCIDGHEDDALEPEVALVQIATHALDAVAKSLSRRKVSIPMEDRASFAKAMKQAMDALANQS